MKLPCSSALLKMEPRRSGGNSRSASNIEFVLGIKGNIMTNTICCEDRLEILRTVTVGDYVWIKAKRSSGDSHQQLDIRSIVHLGSHSEREPFDI